ncbi:serine protease [Glycomyces arizonensis]|uniref:serine protease n=1 Tax=Glycomyces arizonensis TaxID=256035 RepID=UPI00042A57FA|nr:serine protease [Glycomyces arizonensis]
MPHRPSDFIVKVRRTDSGQTRFRGTGLLIHDDLVLTCAHNFDIEDGSYSVKLPDTGWLPIRRIYRHERFVQADDDLADIAVAVLEAPVPLVGSPVALEEILKGGFTSMPYATAGYPAFAVDGDISERKQVTGRIQLASFEDDYRLDLSIDSSQPELESLRRIFLGEVTSRAAGLNLWGGLSGAPVVSGDTNTVVGVCTGFLPSGSSLRAISMSALRESRILQVLQDRGITVAARRPGHQEAVPMPTWPSSVLPFSDAIARLREEEPYLVPERLPFVSPGGHHRAAPATVLSAFASGTGFQLFTGPAGSGKSRYCLETAALADQEGWDVLLVSGNLGDPESKVAAVAAKCRTGKALLVADDVSADSAAGLRTLAEEVSRQGMRVGLLASAGPAALEHWHATGRQRAVELELPRGDEYLARIRDAAIKAIAPRAAEVPSWDAEGIAALCGRRPGLAVLVADALKDRRGGDLAVPPRFRQTGSPIAEWLLKHLSASGLTMHADADLRTAAAVAAVACPAPRQEIEAMVRAALPQDDCNHRARITVDRLRAHGWLTEQDDLLHCVHDMVTDELLLQCFLNPDGQARPTAEISRVLDRFLTRIGQLDQVTAAVARVRSQHQDRAMPAAVDRSCAAWWQDNASHIAALLEADPAKAASTVPALVSHMPWNGILLDHWDSTCSPLLDELGNDQTARILLLHSLRALSGSAVPDSLAQAASDWLQRNPAHPSAPAMLSALLEVLGPDDPVAEMSRSWAVEQLQNWTRSVNAHYALTALLKQPMIRKDDTEQITAASVKWLRRHGDHERASFIIPELLVLSPNQRGRSALATAAALTWLDRHHRSLSAHFVIRPMLDRPGLSRKDANRLYAHVLGWFAHHGTEDVAYDIAKRLIRRSRNGPDKIDAVLSWLDVHAVERGSHQLILQLVRLPAQEISVPQTERAISQALTWLDAHPADRTAKDILESLFARGRRKGDGPAVSEFSPGQADQVAAHVLTWLDAHGMSANNRFWSKAVTFYHCSAPARAEISRRCLEWLSANRSDEQFCSILAKLARRGTLHAAGVRNAVSLAHAFISEPGRHPTDALRGGVFRLLKKQAAALATSPCEARIPELVDALTAVHGREESGDGPEMVSMSLDTMQQLVGIKGLDEQRSGRIIAYTLDWLEAHREHERADLVMRPLLSRDDLTIGQQRRLVGQCFSWLRFWTGSSLATKVKQGPPLVLIGLIGLKALTRRHLSEAADIAFDWMGHNPQSGLKPRLLRALIARPELPEWQASGALRMALQSEPRQPPSVEEDEEDEEDHGHQEEYSPIEDHAFRWLESHHSSEAAAQVIGFLISRLRRTDTLGGQVQAEALRHAREWLLANPDSPHAASILTAVLDDPLELPGAEKFLDTALHWLSRGFPAGRVRHVLRHLVDHPLLDPSQQQETLAHALDWLRSEIGSDTKSNLRQVSFVLRPLAQVHYLTPSHVAVLIGHSEQWLEKLFSTGLVATRSNPHRQNVPDPRYVFEAILQRSDLPPNLLARALDCALSVRHLDKLPPYPWELPGPDGEPVDLNRFAVHHAAACATVPEGAGPLSRLLRDGPAPQVTAAALQWLGFFASEPKADAVITPLLDLSGQTDDQVRRVAEEALAWLALHAWKPAAGRVLRRLLRMPGHCTPSELRKVIIRHCMEWLAAHEASKGAGHVFTSLPGYAGLSTAQRHEVCRRALRWLAQFGGEPVAGHVIRALVKVPELAPEHAARLAPVLIEWVAAHPQATSAGTMLADCIAYPAMEPDALQKLFDAVFAWQGRPRAQNNTHGPVIAMLKRPELTGARLSRALGMAEAYLREHGAGKSAHRMITACLGRDDLDPVKASEVRSTARTWVDTWIEEPTAGAVLAALFSDSSLDGTGARHVCGLAVDYWIPSHMDSLQAPRLLELMAVRTDLARDHYRAIDELRDELASGGAEG